jgi:hypothetical protein
MVSLEPVDRQLKRGVAVNGHYTPGGGYYGCKWATVQKIVRSPTIAGMHDVAVQSNITATATSANVPTTENKGLWTIVKAAIHKMYQLGIVPTWMI